MSSVADISAGISRDDNLVKLLCFARRCRGRHLRGHRGRRHVCEGFFVVPRRVGPLQLSREFPRPHGLRRWLVEVSFTGLAAASHTFL